MREMSIEKARAKLGDIVDRGRYAAEVTVITRHGAPAAVIAPILGTSDRAAVASAIKVASSLGDCEARETITELLLIIGMHTDAAEVYAVAADGWPEHPPRTGPRRMHVQPVSP
jgi:prevent-host-death family protein